MREETSWDKAMRDAGYSLRCVFIPWSRAPGYPGQWGRTPGPPGQKWEDQSLNWWVTLLRNRKIIVSTLYTEPSTQCPSFPRHVLTAEDIPKIDYECHSGREWGTSRPILPMISSVIDDLLVRTACVRDHDTWDSFHAEYPNLVKADYTEASRVGGYLYARLGEREIKRLRKMLD